MKTWKSRYLSILENGPAGKEDFGLAVELIHGGYAVGQPHFSHGRDAPGQITTLLGWAVTTKGREYADDLARQTWRARVKSGLSRAAWMLIGGAVTLLGKHLESWLFG